MKSNSASFSNRYRLAFGDVARLNDEAHASYWLAPELLQTAPVGPRRDGWLAARVLLARLLDNGPLPVFEHTSQGKPYHPALPAFNISNSGTRVAVLVGEDDVGCDIEPLRLRPRFMAIARYSFNALLCDWLESLPKPEQLPEFWRMWTAHEAVLKQRGATVWQMGQLNLPQQTLCLPGLHLHHVIVEDTLVACCGTTPFSTDFAPELKIV